jgi:hypothetical protein
MSAADEEKKLLDEQEALARAGVERAVRGVAVDLIDACSLPATWRQNEMFESSVSATARAIAHPSMLAVLTGALMRWSPKPAGMGALMRRALYNSVQKITPTDRVAP